MDSGYRLAGRYRLEDRVASGGMAEVWRAWDEVLARTVAVKLVSATGRRGLAFRRRFRDEAQAAAGLSHPRVVTVHDYGEIEDAAGSRTPYIVMEFLAGETLADRLGRGPLPVGEAVSVCGQIADALAAAHRAGIVHRDVKPGNVFLTPEGVKVLDFGIARAMRGEPVFSAPFVWPGPSEPTEPLGTAPYLAPEQLGEFSATPSVDVYALGVVLAETLTGKRDPGAPLPGDVPREVEELCVRCRAEDPGARPSAAEIVEILTGGLPREAAPAGPALSPGVPGPDTAVEPDQGSAGRRRQGAVGGAVAAGALVVAAGALAVEIFLLMGHSPERTGPGVIHPTPAAMVTEPAQDAGANGTIMALTRMRPVVDEGLAAGEIRSDVAVDLTNVITNLRNELVAGQTVDLARRLGDLRAKIFTRLREGGLTQPRADQLNALLPDTGAGSSYRQPNPPGGSSAP